MEQPLGHADYGISGFVPCCQPLICHAKRYNWSLSKILLCGVWLTHLSYHSLRLESGISCGHGWLKNLKFRPFIERPTIPATRLWWIYRTAKITSRMRFIFQVKKHYRLSLLLQIISNTKARSRIVGGLSTEKRRGHLYR